MVLSGSVSVQTPTDAPGAIVSFTLLFISIAFSVAGQLTLKAAMERVGGMRSGDPGGPARVLAGALREPRVWLGLGMFGISVLFWLVVLSRVPLSVAYPFVGVSYILIVVMARYVLQERVSRVRWAGVVVIAIGIAVIGLSYRGGSG